MNEREKLTEQLCSSNVTLHTMALHFVGILLEIESLYIVDNLSSQSFACSFNVAVYSGPSSFLKFFEFYLSSKSFKSLFSQIQPSFWTEHVPMCSHVLFFSSVISFSSGIKQILSV